MLSRQEMRALLHARGTEQEELFCRSRLAREEHWGRGVILRGVIEITNVCRVNCDYCPMRKDNIRENETFFMTADQIVARAREIQASGID